MVGALGVEAVSVDHSVLRGQAEDSWLRVSILREWGGTTDLNDGGAEVEQGVGDIGVLVQTGGDTDGVGEGVAKDLNIVLVSHCTNVVA